MLVKGVTDVCNCRLKAQNRHNSEVVSFLIVSEWKWIDGYNDFLTESDNYFSYSYFLYNNLSTWNQSIHNSLQKRQMNRVQFALIIEKNS